MTVGVIEIKFIISEQLVSEQEKQNKLVREALPNPTA